MDDGNSTTLHASCVRLGAEGLLILGPSGAGKSALALALMGMGAALVADDRTELHRAGQQLVADAPAAIRGRIEARGIGILAADAAGPVTVRLVVDLGRAEPMRLPPRREMRICGVTLPLVLGPWHPMLAAALRQLMLGGRCD